MCGRARSPTTGRRTWSRASQLKPWSAPSYTCTGTSGWAAATACTWSSGMPASSSPKCSMVGAFGVRSIIPKYLSAVVPDRRGDRQVARSDPGNAATEAVPDHCDRSGVADVFDRSRDVEHRGVERDRHHQFDAAGSAGVVVVEFDPTLASIEQRRSDRPVPERRVPVDDRADVGVDPEDLLHDHDRRGRSVRVHFVGVEFVSVAGGESCHAATVRARPRRLRA